MKIIYNFASRSRPEKFFETLDNVRSLATHDDYAIVCTLDKDDPSMTTPEVMDRALTYNKKVWPIWGISKNKIDAINRGIPYIKNWGALLNWSILVNISDDSRFLVAGFDKIIIADMQTHFPDLDGVLHYPDSHTKDLLLTMSVMGRRYYDRFGYIYHPDYISLYADQEATEVAKKLGKYKFINTPLYDHLHPVWNMAQWDDQYRHTESFYATDGATYNRRKALNFDLK
jgi:hypothetical protein